MNMGREGIGFLTERDAVLRQQARADETQAQNRIAFQQKQQDRLAAQQAARPVTVMDPLLNRPVQVPAGQRSQYLLERWELARTEGREVAQDLRDFKLDELKAAAQANKDYTQAAYNQMRTAATEQELNAAQQEFEFAKTVDDLIFHGTNASLSEDPAVQEQGQEFLALARKIVASREGKGASSGLPTGTKYVTVTNAAGDLKNIPVPPGGSAQIPAGYRQLPEVTAMDEQQLKLETPPNIFTQFQKNTTSDELDQWENSVYNAQEEILGKPLGQASPEEAEVALKAARIQQAKQFIKNQLALIQAVYGDVDVSAAGKHLFRVVDEEGNEVLIPNTLLQARGIDLTQYID